MLSLLQILGSLVVLAAFVATQSRRLDPAHPTYLLANALGSGVLAVLALIEAQWGFLLLEGVWSLVSWTGLIRCGRWCSRECSPR